MFLSDYTGGQTIFYDDAASKQLRVVPRCGTAVLFTHDVQHEGAKVVNGTKYILR